MLLLVETRPFYLEKYGIETHHLPAFVLKFLALQFVTRLFSYPDRVDSCNTVTLETENISV